MVKSPDTFPFMLIGNKVDLEEDSRCVSTKAAKEWCAQNGNISFIETSASKNQNVEEAFITIAKQALVRQ
jgi:Ras-related protein Rab-7A